MRMRNYMESLHKNVEQQNEERERAKQIVDSELQTTEPGSAKPLEQQIVNFLTIQSPIQINRPWSLNEITLNLVGIYGDHPHPQLVAEVLRKHGWHRRRIYGSGSGRRYWIPPAC